MLNAKSKCIEDLIAKLSPEDEGADVVETAIAAFGYALGEQNAGVSKEGIVNGALPFLFHQMSYQHLLNFDGTSVSYSGLQAAFRQFKCVRALHISVGHWANNPFFVHFTSSRKFDSKITFGELTQLDCKLDLLAPGPIEDPDAFGAFCSFVQHCSQ